MNDCHEGEAALVRCIDDRCCDDLRAGRLYAVLADACAAGRGFVRVVDDSGRGRLYAPEHFGPAPAMRLTASLAAAPAG